MIDLDICVYAYISKNTAQKSHFVTKKSHVSIYEKLSLNCGQCVQGRIDWFK